MREQLEDRGRHSPFAIVVSLYQLCTCYSVRRREVFDNEDKMLKAGYDNSVNLPVSIALPSLYLIQLWDVCSI